MKAKTTSFYIGWGKGYRKGYDIGFERGYKLGCMNVKKIIVQHKKNGYEYTKEIETMV